MTENLKLIIWDLDDTFWNGNLSEGTVSFNKRNVEILKESCDRGILNSICSKNDFNTVIEKLTNSPYGSLMEYFVFPSISWEPKGTRIKKILLDMGLRAENTLFVDDNELNRNEAKYYNPKIIVKGTEILDSLLSEIICMNISDSHHERIKQYRILESKNKARHCSNSNYEFLKESDIRISIDRNVQNHVKRIIELIQRTNQLNYTKKRDSKEAIEKLIHNPEIDCAIIQAKDKYGDYGYVGFYAINQRQKTFIHFLFSCRILGMGIEQYLYEYLDFPDLTVQGNIAITLKKEFVTDWIKIENQTTINPENKLHKTAKKILFKGPCDISGILPFIQIGMGIEMELASVDKHGYVISGTNNTLNIVLSQKKPQAIKDIVHHVPIVQKEDYETHIFDTKYDVVVFSMLTDGISGIYRNKQYRYRIPFSSYNFDLTDKKTWDNYISGEYQNYNYKFDYKTLNRFKKEFVFEGRIPINETISNLEFIRKHLNSKTKLILILGSEIEAENNTLEFKGVADIYALMNKEIYSHFSSNSDIALLNITDFITGQDCFEGCTNHFSKKVYHDIARKLIDIIQSNGWGNVKQASRISEMIMPFKIKLHRHKRQFGV